MRKYLITLFLSSALLLFCDVNALRQARPTPIDNRIRVIVYNPDDVFKYTGFYGYQASIEFSKDETIQSISMGDSMSWQLVPAGSRLFLKPIEPEATTNMTLITNKRTYFFELHAEEANDINDPNMVFNLRFLYPEENVNSSVRHFATSSDPISISDIEQFNFDYVVSGSNYIEPLEIFDDGEFTYFRFKDKNAEIPAIFSVDSNGLEELINYRITAGYVVVEKVVSRFTLRSGKEILCVFNERMPMKSYAEKKRGLFSSNKEK